MMERKPHADVAIAFAEGKEIQFKDRSDGEWKNWRTALFPSFDKNSEWRIKPDRKDNLVTYHRAYRQYGCTVVESTLPLTQGSADNLRLIWDGETGELKEAQIIKMGKS